MFREKINSNDICTLINKIGNEIDEVLNKKQTQKYFYLTILLYSLIENFLKWLIATKILWDESCKQFDEERVGNQYHVDFEVIRKKSKKLTFKQAINKAKKLNLISKRLKLHLIKIKDERNDFIHELWIIKNRNNVKMMKKNLEFLINITKKLIRIFDKIIYKEIGVDTHEVFEIL